LNSLVEVFSVVYLAYKDKLLFSEDQMLEIKNKAYFAFERSNE